MAGKSNHISILQFDAHQISRLRVRRTTKGVAVEQFDCERGDWGVEIGALGAALSDFAKRHQLRDDDVYTLLPRHELTTRIFRLPSQDPDELEGMVRLTAEEHVPFATADLVINHAVLQKLSDGESRVLAAYAHHEVVDHHLKTLRDAGLEPEQIFLSSACLASAAIAAAKGSEERTAVVNLASGGLEVVVIEENQLDYGRAVGAEFDWSLSGPDADDAEEELKTEVRASLAAYRRESEHGLGVERLWICSESFDVTRVCELLELETGYDCTPAGLDLVTDGRQHLDSIPLASLGAALAAQGRGAINLSLLPEMVVVQRRRSSARTKAIQMAVMILAVVVSLGAVYVQAVHQREQYLDSLQAQVNAMAPRVKNVLEKQRQLSILQSSVERSGSALELLSALTQILPASDLTLTSLSFRYGESMEIRGRARSLDAVRKLGEDLRAAGKLGIPQFAQAQEVYVNKGIKERDTDVVEYAITMPFPQPEEKAGE